MLHTTSTHKKPRPAARPTKRKPTHLRLIAAPPEPDTKVRDERFVDPYTLPGRA